MSSSFINVDLELKAHCDLWALVQALELRKLVVLDVRQTSEGVWTAVLESNLVRPKLNSATEKILKAVEGLGDGEGGIWRQCQRRDFNYGFENGRAGPYSICDLKPDLVRRIATAEAGIRITHYSREWRANRIDLNAGETSG